MVLKSLSQGFYRTFLGPKRGFDRTFWRFDRTFLGRSPISGYRFKIPSKVTNLEVFRFAFLFCVNGNLRKSKITF